MIFTIKLGNAEKKIGSAGRKTLLLKGSNIVKTPYQRAATSCTTAFSSCIPLILKMPILPLSQ